MESRPWRSWSKATFILAFQALPLILFLSALSTCMTGAVVVIMGTVSG